MNMIAVDETRITSDAICRQLTWSMQEKEFQADLRLIPLGGCDMVLGIQWPVELGPILWDFKNLRMKFIVDGRKFMLRGTTTSPKKLVSTDQIQKDSRCISQAFTIQIFSMQGDEKNKVEKEQQGSCLTCFQAPQHGKMLTRFNKSFHNFSLEDKVSFDGRENVKTRIKDP